MPINKKKKSKKKTKKKTKVENDLTTEEQILYLTRELESLQYQLVFSQTKINKSSNTIQEYRAKLLKKDNEILDIKHQNDMIISNLTRQYKVMQTELNNQMTEINNKCDTYQNKIKLYQKEKQEIINKYEDEIKKKQDIIHQKEDNMTHMSSSFAQMLKETLEKLSQKIEIKNNWQDNKKELILTDDDNYDINNKENHNNDIDDNDDLSLDNT